MTCACIERRIRLCGQEIGGDGGAGKEGGEYRSEVVGQDCGWITSITTCRSEDCQERNRKTRRLILNIDLT